MTEATRSSAGGNGVTNGATTRRGELLAIAARLFAERGFKNTTVRDIADAAGILSGSLYHHFDSKEAMVDELLDSFQTALWQEYDAIEASDRTPKEKLEAVVRVSFDAIDHNHSEVAIFQTDAAYLATFERFTYLHERNIRFRDLWTGLLRDGVTAGELRADLDVELVYRFLRDTVWVAVRWYRPGGELTPHQVADQYLHILLEGISERSEEVEEVAQPRVEERATASVSKRPSRNPVTRKGAARA